MTLLLYGLLVGGLIAAAAAALASVLRLAGRPARWVWLVALGLTAGLVLAAPTRFAATDEGELSAPVQAREGGPQALRHAPSLLEQVGLTVRTWRDGAAVAFSRAVAAAGRAAPAWLGQALAFAWIGVATLLLALFAVVHGRFARARQGWPSLRLHDTPVRVAPRAGPAVIGLARPEIVVPRWLLDRAAEEQRLVLAHEREHLEARDPLVLAAGCLAAALIPWHPAVWWMLSRLRLAVELDCDARVLGRGVAPRSYGTLLIDLAGQCSGLRLGAPALADESSHLEQRLLAMRPSRPRHSGARAAAFTAAAVLALLAACEAKLPTEAEVADMNVASAESGARKIRLLGAEDSAAAYLVDGVVVTASAARAIPPEKIASIEITKTEGTPGHASSISIRTRKPGEAPGPHDVLLRAKSEGVDPGQPGEMKLRHFGGIVVVDGVRVPESAMNSIPPEDIVSVEVVKGAAATKLYDAPEAAAGVIRITTKKGAAAKP